MENSVGDSDGATAEASNDGYMIDLSGETNAISERLADGYAPETVMLVDAEGNATPIGGSDSEVVFYLCKDGTYSVAIGYGQTDPQVRVYAVSPHSGNHVEFVDYIPACSPLADDPMPSRFRVDQEWEAIVGGYADLDCVFEDRLRCLISGEIRSDGGHILRFADARGATTNCQVRDDEWKWHSGRLRLDASGALVCLD